MTETLTPPSGSDAMADMNAALMGQLAERAARDPLAGLLLARLQAGETADEPTSLDRLQRRFEALLHANQQLREALVAANEMTAWVARLTGACPQCWGLAPDCRSCAGRGRPGHDHPDVDELVDWIAPALRRAGLTLTRRTPPRLRRDLDTPTITEQEMS